MKTNKLKLYSLDEITDKYIGKPGTSKRDAFEYELRLDIIGEAIKQARKERHLTQEELGQLVGVKKAQISKIENTGCRDHGALPEDQADHAANSG